MTTYRAISDTEVAVDAPITQQLMQALKDNIHAIRQGDSSAPDLSWVIHPNPVAGNMRIYGGTETYGVAEVVDATADTFGPNHTMLRTGEFRFRITISKTSSGGVCRAVLYKNGSIISTGGSIGSTNLATYTHDQAFEYGDVWKVKMDETSGGVLGGAVRVAIGCNTYAASTISEICRLNINGNTI
tara:strand:- start:1593 stop:2150 length:558 start_codon:yes stop_codon:yes gene_type:complete